MTRAQPSALRLLLILPIALAVSLMHGGVGAAKGCTARSMPQQLSVVSAMSHWQHAQPSVPTAPAKAHALSMCMSLQPGQTHSPTPPSVVAEIASAARILIPHTLGLIGVGRHPPAPDPVSVLCVSRC